MPSRMQKLLLTVMGGDTASSLLSSLVAYWKLDEESDGSGAVTRVDSLGAHNATDVNNTPSIAAKISNGANFTAASAEQLTVADHADLQGDVGDFFFDLWFKIPDTTGSKFMIAKGSANSGASHEYSLYMNGANLTARVSSGAAVADLVIAGPLSANTWYYAAFWYDASEAKIWGQLNNGAAVSATIAAAGATGNGVNGTLLRFGALPAGTTTYTVIVDEIGRWNRILTGAEILARYNGGAGLTYPF